ncbi:MAG: PSD1 domain-containing protein [Prosthecobacter sp.]|jgi:mono/diheme cytochrome c family protein|uniref:PSD1 and planctomycete cytochrome C domain-containing protein n=1 Tax=Prosthecobacter sp. TaxID=1965333 RepID=UPI0019D9370D|nr:PSD1 and planctomycete cytochrome C domain-containing protein [Prosthecobacter sp.]MBE2284859.1 PSD1 domain-containing protein [Prosthecobacter sp.]
MIGKATLVAFLTTSALHAQDAEQLFVRRVSPLFQEKCLACHGNDEKKIKADYDMRTLESAIKGGESGVKALVPGKPDESPLYLASTRQHEDWEPMPPKEADQLKSEQLAWIKEWIAGGAPWPDEAKRNAIAKASADKWSAEDGITVKVKGALTPEWANRRYKPDSLWEYQPVKKPVIRMTKDEHPVDALLEVKEPAPEADARTLIRRATFDLTGLPPTPEEVAAFESDWSDVSDRSDAWLRLINRLLESPHYGERMARHWLDVVRYADSSGFANDYERGNAWRYRDYVVRSFNADKPFDQFIVEQIAGDEMQPNDPEKLIATGFLRMGPWELTGMEVAKVARQRFLDDVTNSVGETFLAHSLQCARCHDHKFDPVPTHDYYSIQACFATTQLTEREAPFLKSENTSGFEEKKYLEARRAEHLAVLKSLDEKLLQNAAKWFTEKKIDPAKWNTAVAQAKQGGGKNAKKGFSDVFGAARQILTKQGVPEDQYPPKLVGFEPQDFGNERVARKGLERLKWEMERYEPFAFSVYNGVTVPMVNVYQPLRMPGDRMKNGELEQTAILGGGDPFSPTTKVKPGVLSILGSIEFPEAVEGRRTALANWIASKDNPLTTRTFVNRLWLWHFGQAIAGNPNNFGSTGKKPTHPELLDFLAATLVEKGWSVKEMHRLIMTSAAYRRTSFQARSSDELGSSSYATFKPRRLMAEELRDAMLSITGELNPTLGGIPNRPEINIEVAMQPRMVMGTFAAAWVPNPLPQQRHRRSLYALKIRGLRDPFMEVFNEPAPDFSCEAREVSTVTPQVFSLFNGQASYDRALALANRVLKEKAADPISRVFELTFGRKPSTGEKAACEAHWRQMEAKQAKLTFLRPKPPLEVRREAVEENTGEKFSFQEKLPGYADFVPDLQPADCDAKTRALADVCLVLLNSNEFAYLY